jgi:hypothetical protein
LNQAYGFFIYLTTREESCGSGNFQDAEIKPDRFIANVYYQITDKPACQTNSGWQAGQYIHFKKYIRNCPGWRRYIGCRILPKKPANVTDLY